MSLVALLTVSGCSSLPDTITLLPPLEKPRQPQLYLSGNFNGWSSNSDQFEFEGAGLYVLEREFAPGKYRFLVTDSSWSCSASFGEPADSFRQQVIPGSSFVVKRCSDSSGWDKQRNSITLEVKERAKYYFTLKTALNPPRLVIVQGS